MRVHTRPRKNRLIADRQAAIESGESGGLRRRQEEGSMRRRTRLSAFLFVSGSILALTLFARSVAHAQVDTGAILGTVKDQTGAVVPGVKVTATNEGTSLSAIAATGSDGSYVFTPIRIGSYKLTAEFKGFQTVTRPHVSVDVQQQVVVD